MSSKWDKRWLRLAREISSWSKDPSRKIGCVAVKENRLIAHGYNGFPSLIEDDEELLNDRDTKLGLTIHAEMNMILDASSTNRSLSGSTVYVYGLPVCSKCMLHLVGSRVSRIVFVVQNPSDHWDAEWEKSLGILKLTDNLVEHSIYFADSI